jgi:hypothetical protein
MNGDRSALGSLFPKKRQRQIAKWQGEVGMQTNTTGQVTAVAGTVLPDSRSVDESFWPKGWWKLLDFRIGIIPLPVCVLCHSDHRLRQQRLGALRSIDVYRHPPPRRVHLRSNWESGFRSCATSGRRRSSRHSFHQPLPTIICFQTLRGQHSEHGPTGPHQRISHWLTASEGVKESNASASGRTYFTRVA